MNNLYDVFIYSGFLTILFLDSCFILALILGVIDFVKDHFKHRKHMSNVGGEVNV